MKLIVASLGASVLLACGSEPDVDATIHVNPPVSGDSCIGVAGFEVNVAPTGRAARPEQRVRRAPVLNAGSCALPLEITMQDLDIDTPVTVTVTGYDGAGESRVSATVALKSLRDSPVDLTLQAVPEPPLPVLVIYRTPLLQGTPLSSVDTIFISTQKQPTGILNVERSRAKAYFDVEPGAYGVPAQQLLAGGASANTALTVTFTTAQGQTIKETKLNATWKDSLYYEATQ